MKELGSLRTRCDSCSDYMIDCYGCVVGQHPCNDPCLECRVDDREVGLNG